MKCVHRSPSNSFSIFQTTNTLDHSLSFINISTKFINGLFTLKRYVPERHSRLTCRNSSGPCSSPSNLKVRQCLSAPEQNKQSPHDTFCQLLRSSMCPFLKWLSSHIIIISSHAIPVLMLSLLSSLSQITAKIKNHKQ